MNRGLYPGSENLGGVKGLRLPVVDHQGRDRDLRTLPVALGRLQADLLGLEQVERRPPSRFSSRS